MDSRIIKKGVVDYFTSLTKSTEEILALKSIATIFRKEG